MSLNDFRGSSHSDDPDDQNPSGSGLSAITALQQANASNSKTNTIMDEICVNYNLRFASADPIMHRETVIEQALAVLLGKHKPNVLLIGPAGAGKTAIAEELARLIENDCPIVPDRLKGYTIYDLQLSNLIAGSHLQGAMEQKVQDVIDFCSDPKNKAILFMDEVHQLVNKHDASYAEIAQILKPALSRGDLHTICATTTQESRMLDGDPAFNRRFSRVYVDELTRPQTVDVLRKMWPGLSKHYRDNVSIDDQTFDDVVFIADEYISGIHRPDNAITLLDRTCGEVTMSHIDDIAHATEQGNTAMLQVLQANPVQRVDAFRVKRTAIAISSGNSHRHVFDRKTIESELSSVMGQERALDEIVSALEEHDLGLFRQERPLSFLCAGNSGVGKTETAHIVAKTLFDNSPITINMTEFDHPSSINRITGSPSGYIGSDSTQERPFDILESNPYQCIILDELEKGCPEVMQWFMRALDEGHVTTNDNKDLDFTHAIVFATTNAATSSGHMAAGFTATRNDPTHDAIVRSLVSSGLRAEFLNRFDHVVRFDDISKETYAMIVSADYETDVASMPAAYRAKVPSTIDSAALDSMVARTYDPSFGARPARKAVREYIQDLVLGRA